MLASAGSEFLAERHLATLTTLRADGTPHVVAVGFTWDPEAGVVRVITGGDSVKARNVRRGGRGGYASVCQVDGARWLTMEGPATVVDDASGVADAVERYAARYRVPRPNPQRVALLIHVERVLGSKTMIQTATALPN